MQRLQRRALPVALVTAVSVLVLPVAGLAQSGANERAIVEAYAAWVETTNAKDLDRWAAYLAPDPKFFPPDEPALLSRSAILDFYAELFDDPRFALDCRVDSVEVATAEDMAWAHGRCESTFTGPDGLAAQASTQWVKVWKRQPDGDWKCAVNIWNARGARGQGSDPTYDRMSALGLERLSPPVETHFSRGYRSRATALQRGARWVRRLLLDSLEVEPAALELIVLDERDWNDVTDLPYGLHTLLERRSAFLAPALTDRGIYYSEELPQTEARLRVDVIGLHYLAHYFAAEALYGNARSDPPVKWLDELLTLMLQEELLGAIDPDLVAANRRFEQEALQLADPRVRTLQEFDREYRGYFVTPEGGANYAWFLARIAEWSRAVREAHGLAIFGEVRSALNAMGSEVDSAAALRMLETRGVDVDDWR